MKKINKAISLVFSGSLLVAAGAMGACGDDDGGSSDGANSLVCQEVCTDDADCDAGDGGEGTYSCQDSACVLNFCQTDAQCEASSGITGSTRADGGDAGRTSPIYCKANEECTLPGTVCIDVGENDEGVCAVLKPDGNCDTGDANGTVKDLFSDDDGESETVCITDVYACVDYGAGKSCVEAACTEDADCEDGEVCGFGSCAAPVEVEEPEPCTIDSDCSDRGEQSVCNVATGNCECDAMSCVDSENKHDGTERECK